MLIHINREFKFFLFSLYIQYGVLKMGSYLKRVITNNSSNHLIFQLTEEEIMATKEFLKEDIGNYLDICIDFDDINKLDQSTLEYDKDYTYEIYLLYKIFSNKRVEKYISNSLKVTLDDAKAYLFNGQEPQYPIMIGNYDLEKIKRKIRDDNLELRLHFMVDNINNEIELQEQINALIEKRNISIFCYSQRDSLITYQIANSYYIIEFGQDYNIYNARSSKKGQTLKKELKKFPK